MSRLREERERRGWQKARLVHELERLAAAERQPVVLAQRASLMRMLARWENGEKPDDWQGPDEPYARLFCRLFGQTRRGMGWAEPAATAGVKVTPARYLTSLTQSLVDLGSLTRDDMESGGAPEGTSPATDDPSGLTLDWLHAEPVDDLTREASRRVTSVDVDQIRVATRTLDMLDRQVGGEQSRQVAARYLADRIIPMIGGTYSDEVGRDLFQAAAVMCELVGWMAYDVGRNQLARRYFAQGLRMASSAGDRNYGAYVLGSLGDQSLFLGQPERALRLAQAAGHAASSAPSVLAEAALLEARAHAAMQDRSACVGALRRADHAFAAIGPDDPTQGYAHVDEVIMTSHAGSSWVSLGDTDRAHQAFTAVLDQMQDQARRRVYGTIQLANVAMQRHDVEQAGALGIEASTYLHGQASHRSAHHLRRLARSVRDAGDSPTKREFLDRARAALAPQPRLGAADAALSVR